MSLSFGGFVPLGAFAVAVTMNTPVLFVPFLLTGGVRGGGMLAACHRVAGVRGIGVGIVAVERCARNAGTRSTDAASDRRPSFPSASGQSGRPFGSLDASRVLRLGSQLQCQP